MLLLVAVCGSAAPPDDETTVPLPRARLLPAPADAGLAAVPRTTTSQNVTVEASRALASAVAAGWPSGSGTFTYVGCDGRRARRPSSATAAGATGRPSPLLCRVAAVLTDTFGL